MQAPSLNFTKNALMEKQIRTYCNTSKYRVSKLKIVIFVLAAEGRASKMSANL